MKNLFIAVLCALLCQPVSLAQVVVPAGSTQASVQSILNTAPTGSLIQVSSGVYHFPGSILVPCKGLQITGPISDPPTAVIAADFKNSTIFAFNGGCANLGSMQYLQLANTGAVYIGVGNNSNFTFAHNLVSNLPSLQSNYLSESGLWFQGSMDTTLSNVLIEHNTFGDPSSCTAVFATPQDLGGYCAGVLLSAGVAQNVTIRFNNFIHVEEGIHFNQLLTNYKLGVPSSSCIGCSIYNNLVLNYHRIGIEIQVDAPNDAIRVEHNAVVDPLYSSWGTFAVSLPCCTGSKLTGAANTNPLGLVFNDNVVVASKPIGSQCPPFGVEFWGSGSQGTNNLVQGTFCNGFTWGYGKAPWQISRNYICGANYTSARITATSGAVGYITNEEHQTNAPIQTSNRTSISCEVTPSTAPAITQTASAVTLSDPASNHSIYYTTDGSTPTTSSTLYTGPFSPAAGATVKSLAMWGSSNQPKSYPPGYGYAPSAVVSAVFGGTPTIPPVVLPAVTLTGGFLRQASNINKMAVGDAAPFQAWGVYTFGPPLQVVNELIIWSTSDPSVLKVDSSGLVTAVGVGKADVKAKFGSVPSSPWTVTVSLPVVMKYPVAETLAPGTYTVVVSPAGVITVTRQ